MPRRRLDYRPEKMITPMVTREKCLSPFLPVCLHTCKRKQQTGTNYVSVPNNGHILPPQFRARGPKKQPGMYTCMRCTFG